jgi:predicted permease
MTILNALKGIGGEYEVQRVLGAFGTIVFTVSVPALVATKVIEASLEGLCLAYPAGIASLIATTAGAIALKDRQVAKAKAEKGQ